jgi:Protein of unknown function (DUF3106)
MPALADLHTNLSCALRVALVCAAIGMMGSTVAQTSAPAGATTGAPGGTPPAKAAAAPAASVVTKAPVPFAEAEKTSGPQWKELAPAQQAALAPLSASWQGMNSNQKTKWLALSKNYAGLSAAEQVKLQTRMNDWAKLSPQQRAQARHNFAVNQALTSGLTSEQRAAQWQAYQLLSPQEKQELAAKSTKAPVGTATDPRPSEPLKNTPALQFGTAKALAGQPKAAATASTKITIAPHLQKGNSLKSTVSSADTSLPAGTDGAAVNARQ